MKHLSDQQLIASIENLVHREREILSEVLKLFKEIDCRKLFSAIGFTSLFDYATKQLKYSPDQAGRRIAAMRLLRDIPEAEAHVVDGSLTLSSLAQAHWQFKKVVHSQEEKRELLCKLQNATKKETLAILKQEEKTRYIFEVDPVTEQMIEELRGLHPHLSFDELSKKVWEIAYDKLATSKKIDRAEAREQKRQLVTPKAVANKQSEAVRATASAGKILEDCTSAGKIWGDSPSKGREKMTASKTRYIPAAVKRVVWTKSRGKCTSCNSSFGLEFDHIVPFAKGGKSDKRNLRLLCRNCNQRKGIETFGVAKMTAFRSMQPQS